MERFSKVRILLFVLYPLVDLIWLNKATIPNISFLGSLEVAPTYLPGWSHSDNFANLSSNWNLTGTS